jgi:putative membrane-bound dehydrogenase-like protein
VSAEGGKPLFRQEITRAAGAVDVSVDLRGSTELYLVANEGPDGIAGDWTDWIEPVLVLKDGSRTKVSELRPKQAAAGYGGVVSNRNCRGEDLHVAGLDDGRNGRLAGIGTHAPSVIAFDLPAGVERFESKVGLDAGGAKPGQANKVIAMVFNAPPAPSLVTAEARVPTGKPVGFAAASARMEDFRTPQGLAASLFAAEPRVLNPTNIDIDPRGRVWAIECVNYRKYGEPALRPEGDRIVILESTKGDGVADRETTFFQSPELKNGLGLCVLPNPDGKGTRVIASAAGKVWLLTDANGDDKADKVETLLRVEGGWDHDHHVHAVSFGPDGKFYFNMGNAGTALLHADGAPVVDLQGNRVTGEGRPYRQGMIFRCDIDLAGAKVSHVETLAHNFRNNYEVAADSFGGLWQSDNDDDGNKGVRINNIVDYGSYGYTDEMTGAGWRTARTHLETEIPLQHWHQNDPGTIPNLLQTGQGSPTGICVNEGATLGRQFENQVIHCDAGPRTVRAYPVKRAGAGYTAEIVDILTTDDSWYRPSDCCIAPDGSLFVADWYDPGVGGHAMGDNQPDSIRGRIYRVAPKGLAYQIKEPDFGTAETCAAALLSPNLSTRYVAFSKLRAMGEKAGEALRTLGASANPRYRARALHLLARIPGQFQESIGNALADGNADIRATAVRELRLAAANRQLPAEMEQDLAARLLPLIQAESDKLVLREYALALHVARDPAKDMPSSAETPGAAKDERKRVGRTPAESFAAAWVALARKHDGKDRWYLEALGIGAAGREDRAFKAWLGTVAEWDTPAGRDIVWRLRTPLAFDPLTKLLTSGKADEATLPRYLREFDFLPDGDTKNTALLKVAARNTSRLALETDVLLRISRAGLKDKPEVKPILSAALDSAKGKPAYLQLVQAFGLTERMGELLDTALADPKDPGARDAVRFLSAQQPEGMKLLRAALAGSRGANLVTLLGGNADAASISLLTGVVTGEKQPAAMHGAAIRALALTSGGALQLLNLAEAGKMPGELRPVAQSALAMVHFPGLSDRISRTFPAPQSAGGKPLPPIAELVKARGDAAKGRAIFEKAESSCTLCHRVGNVGVDFAPALSEIGSKLGKDAIYDSIINPNAGLSMGFETTELKLTNGASALGIVRSETADQVVLALPGGVTNAFKKEQIAARKKLTTSMMPTGLQTLFSEEEFVNLVEYLFSLKSPQGRTTAGK